MRRVYIAGTADTKGPELHYIKALVEAAGVPAALVDVGTRGPTVAVDIRAQEVCALHPNGPDYVLRLSDRGRAVEAMSQAFALYMASRDDVAGIVGVGGSGGSAIVSAGMQALPVGVPKLLVSTLAGSNAGPFIGATDIALMYSVTDISGLNRISRVVLGNAAHAIAGMAARALPEAPVKPPIGLTMFGVTTACVNQVAARLQSRWDCLVFHATGTGGRSMEKLVDSGMLVGVIDATTTEVCDHLLGGVLSAGPDRLGAIARSQIPYVGSAGALDMVNFWAIETLPERFHGRTLYQHSPQVTLMRTTADECKQIGEWIGTKLNACTGPVRFLIPERGVSALDAPGQPFHDPAADAALFEALERTIAQTDRRRVLRLPLHINDAQFAAALADQFLEIAPRL